MSWLTSPFGATYESSTAVVTDKMQTRNSLLTSFGGDMTIDDCNVASKGIEISRRHQVKVNKATGAKTVKRAYEITYSRVVYFRLKDNLVVIDLHKSMSSNQDGYCTTLELHVNCQHPVSSLLLAAVARIRRCTPRPCTAQTHNRHTET